MIKKGFDLDAWLAGTERDVNRDGARVRSVAVRRRFDADIERVWKAWVEGWKTRVASGEPKPGGTVLLELGQPQKTTSTIRVCDAPSRLSVTWSYGEVPEKPDEVDVRLRPDGAGTVLELEHRSESGTQWAAGIGAGWEAGLLMFEVMLDGGQMTDVPGAEAFPRMDAMWTALVG